jgi:hypothetical protein
MEKKFIEITSKNSNETETMNPQSGLTKEAKLLALPLASDLNSSLVRSQAIGPGPTEKKTMYNMAKTRVR